jgi:hypothetical protein
MKPGIAKGDLVAPGCEIGDRVMVGRRGGSGRRKLEDIGTAAAGHRRIRPGDQRVCAGSADENRRVRGRNIGLTQRIAGIAAVDRYGFSVPRDCASPRALLCVVLI